LGFDDTRMDEIMWSNFDDFNHPRKVDKTGYFRWFRRVFGKDRAGLLRRRVDFTPNSRANGPLRR
jgi:hypothetical protein